MQRVERAVAGGGGGVDAVLGLQRHGRSGMRAARTAGCAWSRPRSLSTSKKCMPGMQRFADQQLEVAFGGFELVALVLHLLDALEQLAAGVVAQAVRQAVLLQLVEDVAAAGQIADQHALAIADQLGLHVLVGRANPSSRR